MDILKIALIILLLEPYKDILPQNLVPNPSFEEYNFCPKDINYDQRKLTAKHWFSPTKGTPDYFNSCSRFNVSVPVNIMGSTFAADGHAYVGVILLEKPDFTNFDSKLPFNYREFICCKLSNALQKDSTYSISFKFAIADFSTYSISTLGFAFSKRLPIKLNTKPIDTCQATEIQIVQDTLEQSVWYTIDKDYIAHGGEKYFCIGNFKSDTATKYIPLDYSLVPKFRMNRIIEDGIAYYYIDAVSISLFKPK